MKKQSFIFIFIFFVSIFISNPSFASSAFKCSCIKQIHSNPEILKYDSNNIPSKSLNSSKVELHEIRVSGKNISISGNVIYNDHLSSKPFNLSGELKRENDTSNSLLIANLNDSLNNFESLNLTISNGKKLIFSTKAIIH